jgi:hypothetical protein
MKIYKRNLEELIHEVEGPFYISNFAVIAGGDLGWTAAHVTVAGFNREGRVCELVLATGHAPHFDQQHRKEQTEQADKWEAEVRTRLAALDRKMLDGRISDTEVLGGLD